jgi:hypothetical protein
MDLLEDIINHISFGFVDNNGAPTLSTYHDNKICMRIYRVPECGASLARDFLKK